jgi:hypothetical protein
VVYWFRGAEGRNFNAPQKLTHPDGSEIQEGQASSVALADWDADGDFDLIIGNFYGSVVLVPNEGSAKEPRWGASRKVQATGSAVSVDGDAGPCVADWDGDGAFDLLVGSSGGAVHWFRKLAKHGEPQLAAPVLLVEGDENSGHNEGDAVRPGERTKVCVTDWNGDGRQDLLVGDMHSRTMKPPPTPSADEQRQLDEANALFRKLSERKRQLRDDMERKIREEKGWTEDRALTDVENDWFFNETFRRLYEIDEFCKLQEEMEGPLDVIRRFQPETETHGYVWVCLRKEVEATGTATNSR